MQLGEGVKQSHGDKLVRKVGSKLQPGEVVLFVCKCNNFRPLVDRLLVTNRRLLAISSTEGKVPYALARQEIDRAEADSNWNGGTLTIVTTAGQKTTFKSVKVEDAAAARDHLRIAADAWAPSSQVAVVPELPEVPEVPEVPHHHRLPADVEDQLRQLGSLHNSGILTDAQLAAARSKVLQQRAPATAPPGEYLGVSNSRFYAAAELPSMIGPSPTTPEAVDFSTATSRPSDTGIDIHLATADQLVAHLAVGSDVAWRVIRAREAGRFVDLDDVVRRAGLAPHELVRFRNRVTFDRSPQPPSTRPTGRVLDI